MEAEEQTSFDLTEFSFEDLLALQEEVKAKIYQVKKENHITQIRKDVSTYGFACRPGDNYDIPDLKRMDLPYYFNVYTHQKNRDDIEDIHVNDIDDEQEGWVQQLKFKYYPKDDDDFEIISEWDWDDHESPAEAKAKMMIPVYYRYLEKPPSKFKAIFEDGNVEDAYLQDEGVYVEDDEICNLGDHDYFIILP